MASLLSAALNAAFEARSASRFQLRRMFRLRCGPSLTSESSDVRNGILFM